MRKNIYTFSFLLACLMASSFSFAQNVAVKFSVDMANETVGNVVNVLWAYDLTEEPKIIALTQNGTEYSTTAEIETGKTIYYLFINGPFVGATSKFEYVDDACANTEQPGTRTRSVNIAYSNVNLETVCFGSCSECETQIDAKFSVDMAVLGAELANNVTLYLSKDLSAVPDFVSMTKVAGTTVWETTTQLDQNTDYYYAFINGDPTSQNFDSEKDIEKGFGLANCGEEIAANVFTRTLTTSAENMEMPTVCYGLCGDCTTNYSITVEVDLEGVELNNESVFAKYYVSDFVNGSVELTKDVNTNIWYGDIPSPSGVKLAYTFSIGNPDVSGVVETLDGADCSISIGAASYRVVDMVSGDMDLDKVCFSTCAACITGNSDLGSLSSEVTIYPNPISSILNIGIVGSDMTTYKIEVLNTLGAVISTDLFETTTGRFTKNVNNLTNGLYFVKISTNEGFSTQKFIKK